ncbi:quinone oxidoreductase family protein [Rathayibacter sp. Leaf296]|uniref:quinone oxidoreductase family protein n=1 Tax=Rathayibacter sp. Leaf296 TaxID=1736327 RepID=UPI000ACE4792|nr:zinc-binding dehydrogenase [Rathayibacter sp. Leaf296]
MRAITNHTGTPEVVDRPAPILTALQVSVQVRAVSLNNGDLSSTGAEIAGFEFSGVVNAIGDAVPAALLGARVMGIAEQAFAEIVVADHRHVIPVPDALGWTDAAALPTAVSTEYGALRRAGLIRGDSVLVTAATSGIALIGLQVARALGADVVIGTTRTAERAELLRRAGADEVVVLEDDADLADAVRAFTNGAGADVVLDHVGGAGLAAAVEAARSGGSVVSVGRLAGPTAEIDLFRLARQRVTLRSVSYGLTPPEILGELFAGVSEELLGAVAAGRVRPIVDRTYAFDDVASAYERLASGSAEGKVVLELS